ncbi:PREDICTED: GLABROUS1 enhancer-binding protein-like [Camelina sativa]|uniref:GLABROUS1 enhancer-binding protein-like n=1 Tax=Camelina sativa TaxID=90675 RepID=A0ABM1QR18_CAMSA|nr:PREDICTED: GLABROUS1 enhancer-binding protein-like [Camelina sativa]
MGDFSKQQLIDKVNKLKKRFRDSQARDTDDEELFRLSKAIWVYEENKDQTKCIVLKEDVPCAEHERVVRNANTEVNNGEEEDGVGDLCVIKHALEAAASYQSLSEDLRKFLLGNLKNVGANQRKELTDGWTALLAKDTELDIKKRTFFAKLVNMGFVSAP